MTRDYFEQRRLGIFKQTGADPNTVPARNERINTAVDELTTLLKNSPSGTTERMFAYLNGKLPGLDETTIKIMVIPKVNQIPAGYEWRTNIHRNSVDLERPETLEARFNSYWSTCSRIAICLEAQNADKQPLPQLYSVYVLPILR